MRNGKKRTRAEWTDLVAGWKSSGLSQKAFSAQRGLAVTTLSWWTSRLRREAQERVSLVAVEVVEDSPVATAGFRVELSNRRAVIVPAGFDAACLQRLVAALETTAC